MILSTAAIKEINNRISFIILFLFTNDIVIAIIDEILKEQEPIQYHGMTLFTK